MKRLMIIVGVPTEHLDTVLNAMAEAGAGRFLPSAAAHPAYGQRGEINQVLEARIETFCDHDKAKAVVMAIRKAHPYEEPVIYLLPLLDEEEL